MKYQQEFRDPELAAKLFDEIRAATTRPWAIMEVCGGQTHSIIRNGIDQLLPIAPESNRADPRSGLPRLRHAA
jgi:hydrogenase expression/formation protein HypD